MIEIDNIGRKNNSNEEHAQAFFIILSSNVALIKTVLNRILLKFIGIGL